MEPATDEMIRAIDIGSEEWVRELLKDGSPVDMRYSTPYGELTPLYRACETGSTLLSAILLDAGADIDFQSVYDRTCLHVAVLSRDDGLCRLLLERGARVDVPDLDARTALWHAVDDGNCDMVKLLVEAGADPLFAPKDASVHYRSPLQACVSLSSWRLKNEPTILAERTEILKYLVLERGLGLSGKTFDGKTLPELAAESSAMQQLLAALEIETSVRDAMQPDGASAQSQSKSFRKSLSPM